MHKKNYLQLCAGILAGNLSIALGVAGFIVPNSIIMGGSTGISLVLGHAFGADLATAVFILNMLLFILGAGVLGRKFALTTSPAASSTLPFWPCFSESPASNPSRGTSC